MIYATQSERIGQCNLPDLVRQLPCLQDNPYDNEHTEETIIDPSGVRGMIVPRNYPIDTAMGSRRDSQPRHDCVFGSAPVDEKGDQGEKPQNPALGANLLFPFTVEGRCTHVHVHWFLTFGLELDPDTGMWAVVLDCGCGCCGTWCAFVARFRQVDAPQHAKLLDYFCGCCC